MAYGGEWLYLVNYLYLPHASTLAEFHPGIFLHESGVWLPATSRVPSDWTYVSYHTQSNFPDVLHGEG